MARSSGRHAGYGCHGGGAAACCSRAPRNERSPPASLRAAKRSWPPSTPSTRSPRACATQACSIRQRTPTGRRRSALPLAGSKRRGSRSRRRSPTSSGAGPMRSTRSPVGGLRSGHWSCCGPRSPWRSYGSAWYSVVTFPPPRGSRRASASEQRAMTAIGVGVDLVEVSRVAAIIADKGSRVFERLLTPTERAYCESRPDPATHMAVRLAAQEAVYKALQGSEAARGIGWREIDGIRPPRGRPHGRLTRVRSAPAEQLRVEAGVVFPSHTHPAAVAVGGLRGG